MNKPQSSDTDELTGFFKRRVFLEEFPRLLAKARSQAMETPLSLALIDLDRFLRINEDYGHSAGDQVIAELAKVIREHVGDDVFCARYGGDEFIVVFLDKEREQAFLTMEQIRTAMANRVIQVRPDQAIEGMSISGGVASFPLDGRSEVELLRKADQALYRAKVAGRGRIRLAYEERMVPKTAHYTQTQLERLSKLAEAHSVSEADLLREAMDDLLTKYGVNSIES